MNKKRILVIPSTISGGVYYYRIYTPFKQLADYDKFDITIHQGIKWGIEDIKYIEDNFDIVIVHNGLYTTEIQESFWKAMIYLKSKGIKFILDIDDYWNYGKSHPANNVCLFNAFPKKMMINFKIVDYVTTTTEYFKNVIGEHFPKDRIYVFENAISSNDAQFSFFKNPSEKLRIGLTGGSSHTEDIKQLLDFPKYMTKKQLEQIEFVFCGYDTKNAEKVILDENNKVVSIRKLDDKDNWWIQTENHFKSNIKNYKRVETKDIMKGDFGKIYEDIDVLLVPLKNNLFNRCKSELKFIEAGFTGTAVIASNVIPYNNFANNNDECLFVDPKPESWAKAIKKLLNDRELLINITSNNSTRIKLLRELERINDKRIDFFENI